MAISEADRKEFRDRRYIRNYEISVWTLQDTFISVLKYANLENKGQIQDGKAKFCVDGTQELSFTIPMYLHSNEVNPRWWNTSKDLLTNPIWENVINGNIIADLRKIKLIINKQTAYEEIYEFIIVKVTERHAGKELYCDVECEGLAFHELGKRGYKISLTTDDFTNDDYEWYQQAHPTITTVTESSLTDINGAKFSATLTADLISGLKLGDTINYTLTINNVGSLPFRIKTLTTKASATKPTSIVAASDSVSIPMTYTVTTTDVAAGYVNMSATIVATYTLTHSANDAVEVGPVQVILKSYMDAGAQPIANINYWTDKFLINENAEGVRLSDAGQWFYRVNMDWSSYSGIAGRDSDKIYEEDYVASWTTDSNNNLVANTIEHAKEKARLVDLEESNIYNLTQDLAQAFGVYCRYIYIHDNNYHIVGRRVEYYNNFLLETNDASAYSILDITYPYSTTDVQRVMEGQDIVTKMYVRPLDLEINDLTSQATIVDVEANPSLEDYLLNFDYLYTIGAISQEQYDSIALYNKKMREYNKQLTAQSDILIAYSNTKNDLEAQQANLSSLIEQANIQADKALESLKNLGDNGKLVKGVNNPDRGVLRWQRGESSEVNNSTVQYGVYDISIKQVGIDISTLKLYRNIKYTNNADASMYAYENEVQFEKLGGEPQYEDGTLTEIKNIRIKITGSNPTITSGEDFSVYMLYTANVDSYYQQLATMYTTRAAADKESLNSINQQLAEVNANYDAALTAYNDLLDQKTQEMKLFERGMGPALREGYWQPEDVSDIGDKYNDTFGSTDTPWPCNGLIDDEHSLVLNGNTPYATFIWDNEYFSEENQLSYEVGLSTENTHYYPYIWITSIEAQKTIAQHLDDLCFMFYDYNWVDTNYPSSGDGPIGKKRVFRANSQMLYNFIHRIDGARYIYPALILTGFEEISDTTLNWVIDHPGLARPTLGLLDKTIDSTTGDINYSVTTIVDFTSTRDQMATTGFRLFYDQSTTVKLSEIVYPRIHISSTALKISEEQLTLSYDGKQLKEYDDYSVLTRSDGYYITLKLHSLLSYFNTTSSTNKNLYQLPLEVNYCISNANTSVYLDAIQVLKESAWPKVSYEVKISSVNPDFLQQDYRYLNQLVRINDVDLKFKDVRGYIYSIDLDLDHPWEDSIEVKNYKTKFEDLFTTIVATTQQMKKNEYVIGLAAQAFTATGNLTPATAVDSMANINLQQAYNKGTLTIDQANGIWGASEDGVVCFRGGGIFTATQQDVNGNWLWNTGILPSGINADLITSGQLDTSKVNIFSGDELRFQWNASGLYAYHNIVEDYKRANGSKIVGIPDVGINETADNKQYVKLDSNGLFLIAEHGAQLIYKDGDTYKYKTITAQKDGQDIDVERVSISWDGLRLRNYDNGLTFWADANTGNLYLAGTVYANKGVIGGVEPLTPNADGDISQYNDFGWIIDTGILYSGESGVEQGATYLTTKGNDEISISNGNTAHGIYLRSGTWSLDNDNAVQWSYQPGILMYDKNNLLFGAFEDQTKNYKVYINLPSPENQLLVSGGGKVDIYSNNLHIEGGDIANNHYISLDSETGTITADVLKVKSLTVDGENAEGTVYRPKWGQMRRVFYSSQTSLAEFIQEAQRYEYEEIEYILDWHLIDLGKTYPISMVTTGNTQNCRTDTATGIITLDHIDCKYLLIHSSNAPDVQAEHSAAPDNYRTCPPLRFLDCRGQIYLNCLWFNPGNTGYCIRAEKIVGKCYVLNCWVVSAKNAFHAHHADIVWQNKIDDINCEMLAMNNNELLYPTKCAGYFGILNRGAFGVIEGLLPPCANNANPVSIDGASLVNRSTGVLGFVPSYDPAEPTEPSQPSSETQRDPIEVRLTMGSRLSTSSSINSAYNSQGRYGAYNSGTYRYLCLKFDVPNTSANQVKQAILSISPRGNSGSGSPFNTIIYAGKTTWPTFNMNQNTSKSVSNLASSQAQQKIDITEVFKAALTSNSNYLILFPGIEDNDKLDRGTGLYYSHNYKAFDDATLYITYENGVG